MQQELEGLRYIGKIRFGGSLANPCIPTDFLVDRLLLGERRRGFSLSSSVSSSITRLGVIFVFASLFPTLFLLIAAVFMINYGLECFANLGIAYIYHSTHQLFEYKFVLVFFFFFFLVIGGLNIH